jgi:hypothetical protein
VHNSVVNRLREAATIQLQWRSRCEAQMVTSWSPFFSGHDCQLAKCLRQRLAHCRLRQPRLVWSTRKFRRDPRGFYHECMATASLASVHIAFCPTFKEVEGALYRRAAALMMSGEPRLTVGLCGLPGSGKSTAAMKLAQRYTPKPCASLVLLSVRHVFQVRLPAESMMKLGRTLQLLCQWTVCAYKFLLSSSSMARMVEVILVLPLVTSGQVDSNMQ